MLNIIIKAVFTVITSLFNIIFSPFLSIITSLFPALSTYFGYVNTFLGYALTYVANASYLLLFTPQMWQTLFSYFAIMYTIHLTILAVKFAFNIYQKLKP